MRRHLPLPALTLSLLLLMLPAGLVAKDKKDDKAPAGPSLRVAVFPPRLLVGPVNHPLCHLALALPVQERRQVAEVCL